MQRIRITLVVTFIIITCNVASTFWSNGNEAMSHSAGAPATYTGSPGDGHTCTSCHAGPTAATQTGWITSNIPASGYVPNTTYTITATATRNNHTKFGFEVSPQNVSGTLLGTLVNTSAQTQLVGTNKYITHTSSGTTGTSGFHTWSFNWTAPVAGTGAVTFYGAFCISNAGSNSSGDTIYKSTLVTQEVIAPSASAVINNQVTCNGGSNGSATANASSGTAPYSYSWNTSPVQTSATATGLPAGTYTVTVSDANTATGTASVTVSQPLPILASLNSGVSICFGDCVSLTCNASGGNGNFSYSWQPTGDTGSTILVCPATLTVYTATATDALGCTGTNSSTVAVNSLPAVSITIDPDTICTNTSQFILTGGSPIGGIYSGAGVSGGNYNPASVGAGTHTITYSYTDSNGCATNDSNTITIHSLPVVSLNLNPDTVCINVNSYLLTGGLPTGGIYYGNGVSGGNFDPASAGSGLQTINYSFTDSNTCSNSAIAQVYVDVCAGVYSFPSSPSVTLYPNPNNGLFSIECNASLYELTIRNILGTIVLSQKTRNKKTNIDLNHLPDGIYFLQLKTNDGIETKRFQISK